MCASQKVRTLPPKYLHISSCQQSKCAQRSKTASLNLTYSIVDIVYIFSLFFCMISDEDVDGIATTIGTIHILRQHIF